MKWNKLPPSQHLAHPETPYWVKTKECNLITLACWYIADPLDDEMPDYQPVFLDYLSREPINVDLWCLAIAPSIETLDI